MATPTRPAQPTTWPGMDTVEVFIPAEVGCWQYSETDGRRWIGFTNGGAVFSPRWCDVANRWEIECAFSVEGGISATKPTRRAMANFGTYAALQGGSPVIITRL